MATAGGPAVDQADHDLGHEADQALALQDVHPTEACLLCRGTTVATVVPGHSLVVVAGLPPDPLVTSGAERPLAVLRAGSVAGEQDTSDVAGRTRVLEDPEQLVDRVWTERVQHVGPVEGDPHGAVRPRSVVGEVAQVLEPGHVVPLGRVEDLADAVDRS